MPRILLVDNGSSRAQSTLALRRLARALGERIGRPVHPVSLLHSDKVPAAALDGLPADTLAPYLRLAAEKGEREFLVVPLFFGPSRALSRFIPETGAALEKDFGPIEIQIASELCPLPTGEPRLVAILADQIRATAQATGIEPRQVLLVDHGSPIPQVSAVRQWLAQQLPAYLGVSTPIREAVMERRPEAEYDFNGPLLEEALRDLPESVGPGTGPIQVIVALLFLAPGRHAGPDGDIDQICGAAQQTNPDLALRSTPLIGEHPGLIEILADRVAEAARI